MTALTEVWVAVKPDMDKFGPEVKKKLNGIDSKKEGAGLATRFGVGFNGAFGGIMSRSAGLFVGAFAAIKGAQVFGGFIKDAAESEKISRITANAIRATGGAAKISAEQVGALATAISNKTGIDDEQIQSAQNMLLTFKNIRNETGKGNDIFNQASQAAADLSVQFGGIDGASKQLGKALNDPVKGITALSKAGVTFTEQQKKQIKTLVASGDVLGAQKIILQEIQGQVGGAAEAAADPLQKLTVIGGNLAEKFGGVLLPTVNKFATFMGEKAAPALGLVLDKAEGFIQSQGFQTFLADVGEKARDVFGFFKTEVLPRLQDFAGFVKDTAAPAIATFATNLASSFAPAVKDVFGFFKTEVLPRLKEFGGFLGDNVLPKIGELATSLSKNKDFLIPFAATIVTVVAALKTWAIVQGILNVILAANPLGLLVVGLAAFVGGLVWAYKNSSVFRDIVNGAFTAIQTVVGLWWNYYLKPIFGALVSTFKFGWEQAQKFGGLVAGAFNAIKEPARAALKFVVDKFLGFVGNILDGAATAFGWIPGMGDKLKGAATDFQKFRTNVNNALDGINDEPVDIKVGLAYTQALGQKTKQMKFAKGGGVFGAGTSTSDSIPALLSNNEHVLTAKEVAGAGGHKAVESMRSMWSRGYAAGGPVLRALLPDTGRLSALASTASSSVSSAGSAIAKSIAKQLVAGQSNPGLAGALSFARGQAGKPYGWGAVGPSAYDCSGFMSAITNVILGRSPYSRLFATGSFPTSMFARGMGAFSIGSRRGNPGHMAGTLNGVDVESRGGAGVVTGSRARGAKDSLFGGNIWHLKGFAKGGAVQGDAPYDSLKGRRGLLKELGIDTFDTGGKWKSGTLAANLSGKTETVRTAEQEAALGRGTDLSANTISALASANKKAFRDAMNEAKFRLVGNGGSYTLQMTNG